MAYTITPIKMLDYILDFCGTINDEEPYYVDVLPTGDSNSNDCFINVENKIKQNGGRTIFGWTIWLWPTVMIEAEFHAIWEDILGNKIDVTPKENKEKRILFLPDKKMVFNGIRINNIRENLNGSNMVERFIELNNQLYELMNTRENKHEFGLIKLDRNSTEPIYKELSYILQILTKKIRIPNDNLCPCGSGKRFSKCCKRKI
jgi:hypothetical protein